MSPRPPSVLPRPSFRHPLRFLNCLLKHGDLNNDANLKELNRDFAYMNSRNEIDPFTFFFMCKSFCFLRYALLGRGSSVRVGIAGLYICQRLGGEVKGSPALA